MGWLFTICFTYIGFALFLTGSLWSANIKDKCLEIHYKWKQIRGYTSTEEEL
jgi:hypothetical protein